MDRFPELPGFDHRPVLVLGVGNTHGRLAFWRGEACVADWRLPTDELEAWFSGAVPEWPVVVVSVVPEVTRRAMEAWEIDEQRILSFETSGLLSRYEPPGAMGADRLANALALRSRRYAPGIVVDCGTATTLTVVDGQGVVAGGAIACGLETAARALWQGTALLDEVPLVAPVGPWGTTTLGSLQQGLFEGHVGLVRHLVDRARQVLGEATPVVFTGGWGSRIAERFPGSEAEPLLTLEGGACFGRTQLYGE